ncbi:hypothetical protein [Streptomyces sp. LMG1-1-1.1]|uniref:hypothetical protein n=1 Tax=Streptomyces sp. LMG1-1-1.1 TaxID=3135245 RepID=UPI0034672108
MARHQLQKIAVHPYHAQLTLDGPAALPDEVALDGVDEFLATCVATTNLVRPRVRPRAGLPLRSDRLQGEAPVGGEP